jgi:choline dehydrogenase-like flavoprotein
MPSDIPGYNYYNSLWQSSYDWQYNTVPQPFLDNKPIYWPRGRVIGGTSATNAMFFVRPSETEINAWESIIAPQDRNTARNWGWGSLFDAMKKSETFHAPSDSVKTLGDIRFADASHGKSGPIHATFPP